MVAPVGSPESSTQEYGCSPLMATVQTLEGAPLTFSAAAVATFGAAGPATGEAERENTGSRDARGPLGASNHDDSSP